MCLASARDSAATESDHRLVAAALSYATHPEQEQQKVNKRRIKHSFRPKPIQWTLTDPIYNFSIIDEMGIGFNDDDAGCPISRADLFVSLHCFTDGCFIEASKAGWAFSVFEQSDANGEGESIVTAASPVVLLRKSRFYIGSERHTSCVAELNAVVEALLWWASVAESV